LFIFLLPAAYQSQERKDEMVLRRLSLVTGLRIKSFIPLALNSSLIALPP
jgi:hypothetical protein